MLPGRLTVSVAIAVLNEGPDLEAMLAMILAGKVKPDEIVIVDDASIEPVAPRVARLPGVRVIRNRRRMGSGPAKHHAALMCTGDIVIVLDSHMRLPWDWLELWLADHAERPGSILTAVSRGFESHHPFYGMGADLVLEDGFWKPKWAEPRRDATSPYRVPCVIGGAYLIPRHILKRIGGYAPGLRGYGIEEEYLSIRAYMVGADCAVSPRVICQHNYNHGLSRKTADSNGEQSWEMPFNRLVASWVCFPGVKYPASDAPKDIKRRFEAAIQPNLSSARTVLAANTVRNNADLARLCGIVHPKE